MHHKPIQKDFWWDKKRLRPHKRKRPKVSVHDRFPLPDAEINEKVSTIMTEFYEWENQLDGKLSLLANFQKDIYRIVTGLGSTRYHPDGLERIKRKVKKRMGKYYSVPGIMLTLQFDGNRFDVLESWEYMKSETSRLMDAVNIAYKRRGWSPLKHYFSVVEEQPTNGRCHLHMVFPHLKYLDYKLVKRLWGNGYVGIDHSDQFNLASYACKYISKFGHSDIMQAMLWHFKMRLYSFSRSFVLEPFEKAVGWFVYPIRDTTMDFLEGKIKQGYKVLNFDRLLEAENYGQPAFV